MTDPQLPPSGAVPSEPLPADAGVPTPPSPPAYAPAPPAYIPTAQPQEPSFPAPSGAPISPPGYAAPTPGYAPAPGYPIAPAPGHPIAPAPGYPGAGEGSPAAPMYPTAPPGAYQVPVGGYAAAPGAYPQPVSAAPASSALGVLALILALVAAVVVPIIAGVSGFEIGQRLPSGINTNDPDFLSLLSPARDQVLWAEISFWAGTILGIAAIVIGIIAIRAKKGRGAGIPAIVVSAIGPVVFWVVLLVTLSTGMAAGFLP